jgi:hypothetical protein
MEEQLMLVFKYIDEENAIIIIIIIINKRRLKRNYSINM